MRNSLTEVVVVLAVMAATHGAIQEDHLALTTVDFQILGQFLAELTHSLFANTAALCLLQDQGVNGTLTDYLVLSAELTRRFVFVVPCDVPLPKPRPCLTNSRRTFSATCPKSGQVAIYITDSKQMEQTMVQVEQRYRGSRGAVTQVVVGRQLKPPLRMEAGVMSWILASYSQEEEVNVQEIFTFKEPGTSVVRQPLGKWRPNNPLKLTYQPGLGPEDFQGNTIVCASFPYPPYFMTGKECTKSTHSPHHDIELLQMNCVDQKPSRQLDSSIFIGYFIDIFSALSQKLNFTYRVVMPSDPKDYMFGTGHSDNYSGIVGILVKKEAEIALASLSMSQERLDDIDFSTNIDYYVRNLYIRANATESSIGWGTYAKVFAGTTWLGTGGVLLISTCSMWVLSRGEKENVPWDILSFKDIVFMFFSCLVQQGVPTTPESMRGRTVFWLFWLSCVVLYAYYTARLTSYLAVSTASPPFTTFQGAVDKYPEWEIGIMKGTPLRTFIKDAKSTIYQQFSSRLDENPHLLVDSEETGVRRLLSKNYAFLTDTPVMKYVYMSSCTIKEIEVDLFANFGRLGYIKNLPYAGVFDLELTRMNDGGLLDRLRRRWFGSNVPCEEPSPFTEIDFTHTVTAFIILLLGLILGLALLSLERLHMRMRLRKLSAFEGEVRARKAERDEQRRRGRKRKFNRYSQNPSVDIAFVENQREYMFSS